MARPKHKPTAAQRRTVSIAASGGMAHWQIALAIGISKPTLELHYQAELTEGACKRRLEVIVAAHKAAMKGNVSAQRLLLSVQQEVGVPTAEQEGKAEQKPAKVGKKEQAKLDAVGAEAGTGWDGLLPEGVTPIRKAG